MRISQEKGSTTNNVKTLYDIEVTKDDKENKRVKISYVGYCESYDKWREYEEKPSLGTKRNLPTKQSLQESVETFHKLLSIELKKKL